MLFFGAISEIYSFQSEKMNPETPAFCKLQIHSTQAVLQTPIIINNLKTAGRKRPDLKRD
jgi:hypothetical protein